MGNYSFAVVWVVVAVALCAHGMKVGTKGSRVCGRQSPPRLEGPSGFAVMVEGAALTACAVRCGCAPRIVIRLARMGNRDAAFSGKRKTMDKRDAE